jgi:hypothetical protein
MSNLRVMRIQRIVLSVLVGASLAGFAGAQQSMTLYFLLRGVRMDSRLGGQAVRTYGQRELNLSP